MDIPPDKWHGRWYVPVLVVAAAVVIIMAIAQRTGDVSLPRLSMTADSRVSVAGASCEPGIGC